MSNIKIIFFGTGDFAVPALKALVEAGLDVLAAVTAPDKPIGRKQILSPPPVKLAAQKLGLPILQPEKLKDLNPETWNLKPDLGIVAAYGKLIPPEIFNLPKHGTLNIHPSLLPKYRGPSPIQTAILNGDTETGVTIMKVDEEMDHGDIVAAISYQLSAISSYKDAHDDLAKLGAELLIKTLPDYLAGKIKPQPQDESLATFTKKITTEDGEIKTNDAAQTAYNKIRALNPDPGAFIWFSAKGGSAFGGKKLRLKILDAELEDNHLEFKKVKLEGGKPMNIKEFLRGHPNFTPYLL